MRNKNQEIINQMNKLDMTTSSLSMSMKVLEKCIIDSNELLERGKSKSYIIGYLQGYIKAAVYELDHIIGENIEIQSRIESIVDPLD